MLDAPATGAKAPATTCSHIIITAILNTGANLVAFVLIILATRLDPSLRALSC